MPKKSKEKPQVQDFICKHLRIHNLGNALGCIVCDEDIRLIINDVYKLPSPRTNNCLIAQCNPNGCCRFYMALHPDMLNLSPPPRLQRSKVIN